MSSVNPCEEYVSPQSFTLSNDQLLNHMPDNDFTSDIFTIIVGPERRTFTAHGVILSKSPKFAAQCNGSAYVEGSTKTIELPDHDPIIFALLLEYLYSGDYWPRMGPDLDAYCDIADKEHRTKQYFREAKLYCMAGYYLLADLQKQVLEKFEKLKVIPDVHWLKIIKHIYDNNYG